MLVSKWLRTPRVRRSIAAGSLVLSIGGLVLLRAPASSAHPTSKPTFVQINNGKGIDGATNGIPFSGAGLHGTFALDDNRVLAGENQQMFAEIRVTADAIDGSKTRAPLSLAVVLDHSGSMGGQKLDDAKRSLKRLIGELRDDDEIAFVKYDDTAKIVQPLARVEGVRASLLTSVDAITADGGTNIAGGLQMGELALGEVKEGRVKRIILLSDGLDSTRSESERIASSGTENHVTTSSIGIGLDFNEGYMSGVARSGHGNFAFVNDTEQGSGAALTAFLTRELNDGANTTIQGATARLHLPDGVRFVSATGADGSMASGGTSDLDLRIGDLVAGEERRIVVELASTLASGDSRSLDGHVSWSHLDGSKADAAIAKVDIVASKDASEVDKARDPEVTASAFSVFASKKMMDAADLFSRGFKEEAVANANAAQSSSTALGGKLAGMVGGSAPAAALEAQGLEYQATADQFAAAAPSSAEGRAAAKTAVVRGSANLKAKAY